MSFLSQEEQLRVQHLKEFLSENPENQENQRRGMLPCDCSLAIDSSTLSQLEIQKKFILSRGLLRLLLSNYLPLKPQNIPLATNPWGKLFLPDYPLHFNLTHSRSMLVFALSPVYTVGVDVEYVRPLNSLPRLVQRYATPAEHNYYQSLVSIEQKTRYFLELWTAKEAYSKALGTGLTGTLCQFAHLDTLNQTQITPPGGWPAYLQRFNLQNNNYVGAVCWGTTPGANASIPAQIQSADRFPPKSL